IRASPPGPTDPAGSVASGRLLRGPVPSFRESTHRAPPACEEVHSMTTVSEVTKGFGGRTLFQDVSVSFTPGHNYGLTGPNGSGKSTFMKILIGAEEPDKGTVTLPRRVGWLRQDHFAFDDYTVLETVLQGN